MRKSGLISASFLHLRHHALHELDSIPICARALLTEISFAPNWPGGARVAVQFVLNYEEGGESCVLHGDGASETFLSEIIGATPYEGARHLSMESIYEYGARAGVWRILDLFRDRQVPLTVFAVAMAAERNPGVIERMLTDEHEIASHGLRWINYHGVAEETERAHMQEAMEILTRLCGEAPVGWYTGRTSENTRRLVAGHGGFLDEKHVLRLKRIGQLDEESRGHGAVGIEHDSAVGAEAFP